MNRGTGAGGANTNFTGKGFGKDTDVYEELQTIGFVDKEHKISESHSIKFATQRDVKILLKDIDTTTEIFRIPDEAYLINKDGNLTLKILEKKNQNYAGSVETKLWACPSLKREMQIVCGNNIKVEYAFCLSPYLKKQMLSNKPKYNILMQILKKNNIDVFYGLDDDYFDKLQEWI